MYEYFVVSAVIEIFSNFFQLLWYEDKMKDNYFQFWGINVNTRIKGYSKILSGKSILQVPDTGTSQYWWILKNFWWTSIGRKCDIYVL